MEEQQFAIGDSRIIQKRENGEILATFIQRRLADVNGSERYEYTYLDDSLNPLTYRRNNVDVQHDVQLSRFNYLTDIPNYVVIPRPHQEGGKKRKSIRKRKSIQKK